MIRRITDSFSIFGTRKVTAVEQKRDVAKVRRAITTPMVRERIMLSEMFGYFQKRPLTDDPNNPPASRTVKIKISDEGVVTFTQEIFSTPTGEDLDAMEHSGVGGWSWAAVDGSGKPDFRYFAGLDYKRYPNVSKLLGRTVSMFESAPEMAQGSEQVVETGMGDKVRVAYAVMDVRDLIISNAPDGTINPDFPAELQPRDRTDLKSKLQALDISRSLDISRLSDSTSAGEGAPIIGPDNVVESGNGRAMGILRAYASGTADHYRDDVITHASDYGLSQSVVERFESPVLVRVRLDDVDRAQFAIDANIPMGSGDKAEKGTAAMMEATPKELSKVRGLIMDSTSITELVATITAYTEWDSYERANAMGRLVGSWFVQLVNGTMSKEAYAKKAQGLLGMTYIGAKKKIGLMTGFAYGFCGQYRQMDLSFVSGKKLFTYMILQGEGLDVKDAWKAWMDAKAADLEELKKNPDHHDTRKMLRPAAVALRNAIWPFMEKVTDKKTGTSNFQLVVGAWEYFTRSRAFDATDWRNDRFSWWSIGNRPYDPKFAATKEEAIQNYSDIRQRVKLDFPDFHPTIDAMNTRMRNFTAEFPDVVKKIEEFGSPSALRTWGIIKRMFETQMLSPRLGNDGLMLLKSDLMYGFHGALESLVEPGNEVIFQMFKKLKAQHNVSAEASAHLADGVFIDPALLKSHEVSYGKGRLRSWIAECFQVIGGRPKTLERFTLCDKASDNRANANVVERAIMLAGSSSKKTVWHEIGHHYEFSTPGTLEAAQAYLITRMSRYGSNEITPLKGYAHDNYGDDEFCIKDGLYQPYLGKVYAPQNDIKQLTDSEVFSIGLEYLSGESDGGFSMLSMDGLIEFVYVFIKEHPTS